MAWRKIITAIAILQISTGWSSTSMAADKITLTGAVASDMIRMTLAEHNLDGAPTIAKDRVFPPCDGRIAVLPMFGGWNTVSLRCDTANGDTAIGNAKVSRGSGWKFAIRTNLTTTTTPVPVRDFKPGVFQVDRHRGPIQQAVGRQQSSVQDEIDVVALTRSVTRGDVITVDDVMRISVPARNVSGAFFDPQDVIGRRMKTSLAARRPVHARHLHPDFLVEEDSEVLILASAGGISVDMLGYALENGQVGDWIKVQNASSGKTVRAKIIAEKKVVVIAKRS